MINGLIYCFACLKLCSIFIIFIAIANIQEKLKSVAHKIVILSGKGGVGKSTFAACLAYGLATDDKIQVKPEFLTFLLMVHQC